MNKKKLLFVIESLCCGGAEKSLTCLLQELDYEKYEVDLQLFAGDGDFEKYIPDAVHFLEPLEPVRSHPVKKPFVRSAQKLFGLRCRFGFKSSSKRNMLMWRYKGWIYRGNEKEYDAAIAYSQGMPTFYVADKINAKIKIAYKNSISGMEGKTLQYYRKYYAEYTYLIGVSEKVKALYTKLFPQYVDKLRVIYDINNAKLISELAQENVAESFGDILTLVTVGRLAPAKGYDLLVDAATYLKKNKITFRWYIIGEGQMRGWLEEEIRNNELENDVILLGKKMNPYPYMNKCDIYAAVSRREGFGLTLAEAKILEKPIVSTNFDSVYEQLRDGETGLIVNMGGQLIAEGIMRMASDDGLRENIVKNLKVEKKGNIEEAEKFQTLLEGQ